MRTAAELRTALRPARRAERTIGLVPTMGALHAGHLSLIRRAREECDEVVMSLFVNPTQFDDAGDLAAYPRDEERDLALAAEAGVDIVYAPAPEDVYPPGFATTVQVGGPAHTLEGEHRGAGHFNGVATVVTKLLNVVGPDVAYFGQKDAQQTVVIRRLVCDLDLPVRVEVCPTVREPDGLAMSSRNVRLSAAERERALSLSRGLSCAATLAAAGERRAGVLVAAARAELDAGAVDVDYVQLVDAETLEPVSVLSSPSLLLIAGRVGDVRLIDNAALSPRVQPALSRVPHPSRSEQRCSV